jgi:hypothetical protein
MYVRNLSEQTHWGIEGHKKGEKNQAIALTLGGKCRKDRSGRFTRGRSLQTAGCTSTNKIVSWYWSFNIFGYQILDN